MGRFSQIYIRSVIEELWLQSSDEADSFYNTLISVRRGKWQQNAAGWMVESTSGAGYSTTFHIPASSEDSAPTPLAMQELLQELVEAYRLTKAAGKTESDPNDAFMIYMQGFFPTIKAITNDWRFLRP